jgi:hypothetical protein
MRYRLAVLLLFAVLPVMSVLAAPAPDPSAILDIGPPPKVQTAEEYCQFLISRLPNLCGYYARADPAMKELPSLVRQKYPWLWLEKHLRVTPENGGRRLRLTFRAGSRDEQRVILNALGRTYLRMFVAYNIKRLELGDRLSEAGKPGLAKLIKETRNPDSLEKYLEQQARGEIAEAYGRAEMARLKQITVIKWAK